MSQAARGLYLCIPVGSILSQRKLDSRIWLFGILYFSKYLQSSSMSLNSHNCSPSTKNFRRFKMNSRSRLWLSISNLCWLNFKNWYLSVRRCDIGKVNHCCSRRCKFSRLSGKTKASTKCLCVLPAWYSRAENLFCFKWRFTRSLITWSYARSGSHFQRWVPCSCLGRSSYGFQKYEILTFCRMRFLYHTDHRCLQWSCHNPGFG